jgi:very-short-patch-repair endonuclease
MDVMPSNFHYNKNLKSFARNLRNEPTKGENSVWYEVLQNKKMKGYRFLRQRSISKYIVDFFCKDLMLVIEVDGYTHDYKVKEDEIRDKELIEFGYHILHIPDQDVFNSIENVTRAIEVTIEKIEKQRRESLLKS